ncbi:hypothetical protein [Chenggangzhangella methanolivorans]|uniref:hypothetical protein n=1 Tax=Chenggangzhangella methanolivorans TaxID=1437009 RepID=UPI0021BDB79C|nr:hypothetical protein [Chenggangzhangella methanolivorans]
MFGRGSARKPVATVMAEIAAWRQAGFNTVHLVDDTFTRSARQLEPLLSALGDVGSDFAWTAMTRADLVNPALLSCLGRSGCVGLLYGVDTGSPEALARLSKRAVRYPDIAELALWNVEAGIAPTFYFLIDLLRDTMHDLELSLAQAARASAVDPGSVRLIWCVSYLERPSPAKQDMHCILISRHPTLTRCGRPSATIVTKFGA